MPSLLLPLPPPEAEEGRALAGEFCACANVAAGTISRASTRRLKREAIRTEHFFMKVIIVKPV